MPYRLYGHLGLVISAEEAANLEGITGGISGLWVQTHLVKGTVIGQQLTIRFAIRVLRILDAADYIARIVDIDDTVLFYRCIVAAAKGLRYSSTLQL